MNKDKVLVVAHDAGGADIIGAYVRKNRHRYHFVSYVAGPAERVFKRRKIPATVITYSRAPARRIVREHRGARFVLTGTGWMTNMELGFVREAKRQGLKAVSYIDHWVTYRERFGYPRRDWQNNLPDEIWTGDASAYGMARRLFSRRGVLVRLVPNETFREARVLYLRAARHRVKKPEYVLFVSEPFGVSGRLRGKTGKSIAVEYTTLQSLLDYFSRVKLSKKILIRLHPAEPAFKYDALTAVFSDRLDISISREPDMFKDLARASTVIGMESMFLVIAAFCGKRVISFSPGKHRYVLPFGKIVKVTNAAALRGHIR